MALTFDPSSAADWTKAIAGGFDLFSAAKGTDIDRAREAAALADPFATQRAGYQKQLNQLLTDPNSFKTDPGYQFALGQGQEAVTNASDALYGTRRTGALAPELAKYTEGYASQAYDDRIKQLMQLAGANSGSPGTAGTLLAGGFDNQNKDVAGGIAGLVPPILSLISGIPNFVSGLGKIGDAAGGFQNIFGQPTGKTGGSITNPVPSGAKVDPDGNVFDVDGKQIGVLDQNGNMVPSYPTNPYDVRLPSNDLGEGIFDPSTMLINNSGLPDPSDVIGGSGFNFNFDDIFSLFGP